MRIVHPEDDITVDQDGDYLPLLAIPEDLEAFTNGQVCESDERAETILRGASAAIRRWIGWHASPVIEETITLDGPGFHVLHVPTQRLRGVVRIEVDGETVSDVTRFSRSGMIERDYPWPSTMGSIKATVIHGFHPEEAEDLRAVCLQLAAAALANPSGASAESVGGMSISWGTQPIGTPGGASLLARDLAVLDGYRLLGRP